MQWCPECARNTQFNDCLMLHLVYCDGEKSSFDAPTKRRLCITPDCNATVMSFKDQVSDSSRETTLGPLHHLFPRMVELRSAGPQTVQMSFGLQTHSMGVGRVDLVCLLYSARLSREGRATSYSPVHLMVEEDIRQVALESQ